MAQKVCAETSNACKKIVFHQICKNFWRLNDWLVNFTIQKKVSKISCCLATREQRRQPTRWVKCPTNIWISVSWIKLHRNVLYWYFRQPGKISCKTDVFYPKKLGMIVSWILKFYRVLRGNLVISRVRNIPFFNKQTVLELTKVARQNDIQLHTIWTLFLRRVHGIFYLSSGWSSPFSSNHTR